MSARTAVARRTRKAAKQGGGAKRAPRSDSIRDPDAGYIVETLRMRKGISRRDMPQAMMLAGIKRDRIPSASTIYAIEVDGVRPRVRTMAALAEFFERDVDAIWTVAKRPTTKAAA